VSADHRNEAARVGVGIDFGTSNSAVAWFDGEQLHTVRVDAGPILPSALHLGRDFVGTTGSEAIERYVAENSARLVHLVPEIIGESASTIRFADDDVDRGELESSRNPIFGPLIDHGLPGRLFLGLKRLLGNPSVDRLAVFDRPYRLVALLTPVLLRLRESVQRELRRPVEQVHIGRPVDFEGSAAARNTLALNRLTEAAQHAGLRGIVFYPEPVAATLSFLWHRVQSAGTVLTVDFGGGTLDLCVLRHSGVKFQVLATAGVDWGGDRIDQLIFRRLLFPLLGEGERWSRSVEGRWIDTPFPFHEYEEGLLNWAITHTLNQNRYKTKLTELIAQGGPASVKFERLKDLINYNYGYSIFRAIKQAKAELSVREASAIDLPELNLTVPFTRAQFDILLGDMLERLSALVHDVVARSHLSLSQIDRVVRTGGSSQIVAVRDLLERFFPGKVIEHDPFTSVAGGLAIADFYDYR
jgi:hypothetical chaperone protein